MRLLKRRSDLVRQERASVLELDGLTKRYGEVVALDGCEFSVPRGRMVGFVGPNGAGKTTAMRSIFGLVRPDAGGVQWDGAAVGAQARKRFGYMPEERGLYVKMRVRHQLMYFARLHGMSARSAADEADRWLERLDLTDRAGSRLDELSHGNQQRVQLAVALVHEPELLVLDEPFAGLDPIVVREMGDVLAEEAARGAAVVFSSHQLDLVEGLVEDVAIIHRGKIVRSGSLDELRDRSAVRYVEVSVEGVDRDWWPQSSGTEVVRREGDEVRLAMPAGGDPGPLQVVRLVISRELHVRMRSRPFIISTVVIWLLVGGLVVAASLADRDEGQQETVRFGLVGSAADRAPAMGEVAAALDLELVIKGFQSLPAADAALVDGRVDAVLTGFDVLRFAHELDPRLALIANQAVRAERLPERLDELGLTEEQAAGLLRPEPLPEVGLLDPGDDDGRDRAIIAYGPVLLLGAIVFAGQLLLLGVIEEKSSRVVEVLLATLRPAELLFGKVIAILALALFQMVSIGVIGGGLAVAVMDVELPDISIVGVVSVVPWFLMGFLFYGTAFAAVGATVSRQEDASTALMPLMIVMVASELASILVIGQEGPVAILALVPFTAPMAMPSLIVLGDVGPWLVAASVLVMVASTAGMLWVGARLYAGAVLRTGPRISVLAAWRSREMT